MTDIIVNFDEPRERSNFMRLVGALSGKHRIEIARWRKNRSNQQNRYMWGVVYPAFVQFRHEQGEEFDAENAHEFFKLKFLRRTVVNHDTGEILGTTVGSTASLNTAAFAEYLDKVIAWLADLGIVVPQPDQTYEMEKA